MGHLWLGRLPRYRNWRQVVELIEGGAGLAQIVAATQKASVEKLRELRTNPDPGLVYSLWLLTQIPLAAKQKDFSKALSELGMDVSDAPTLPEIVSSLNNAIDESIFKRGQRTDMDEIGQMAALSAFSELGRDPNISFLKTTPEDVQQRLAKFSTKKNFGILARGFFARFMSRYLSYFLSAELSKHVGEGRRFNNIQQHSEFNNALDRYCKEASFIVEKFSGDWYSKANYEGEITLKKVSNFLYIALRKLRKELKQRGDEH